MSLLDLSTSFLLTLALHATVLLGAAWLAERAGWLRHTGWAEFAWRLALFGALVSTTLAVVPTALRSVDASVVAAVPVPTAGGEAQARVSGGNAASATSGVAGHEPARIGTMPAAINGQPTSSRAGVPHEQHATSGSAVLDDRLTTSIPAAPGTPPTASTPLPRGLDLRPDPIALPEFAAALVLMLWTLGIGVGALRLSLQALALRRLGRAIRLRGEPASTELDRLSHRLAGELGIAAPTLRVSPQATSPMVLPGANVLLPTWAQSLDATQQRALLAHELSHLQRRDPAWRVAQRLALLPLFFHPLAWHARHRLEALAEDACDARAMQLLGSGRPLAECLATCLSHAGARAGQPALAVAMAGASGPVLRRVQNLLEESRMSLRPMSPALRRTAIALAVVALVALPGLAVTTVASALSGDGFSRYVFSDDDSITVSHSDGDYKLRLKMTGKVVFNDDSSDIAHLGAGAKFRVSETRDGVEREIRYFGKDGVIQREYRLDGKVVALDADGRAWLAKMLPDVMRESGINAEARGKQLLAKGGPDALLAEIAKIESDHSAGRYLAVLFANAKLDATQLTRALTLAKGIDSDFELRQALQAALTSQTLPPAQQVQVLRLSNEIGSDFEQAELLVSMAETGGLQGDVLAAWREAVARIGSDFEQRRVIEALMDHGEPSPATVAVALDSSHGIGSDFETREVLTAAAPRLGKSTDARAAYLRLAATIGSDFELREALKALLEAGPVDVAIADGVLSAVADIGSDFEAGEVLTSLARVMPNDAGLIQRYRVASRRLGDFERGQAEKALDRFAVAG